MSYNKDNNQIRCSTAHEEIQTLPLEWALTHYFLFFSPAMLKGVFTNINDNKYSSRTKSYTLPITKKI